MERYKSLIQLILFLNLALTTSIALARGGGEGSGGGPGFVHSEPQTPHTLSLPRFLDETSFLPLGINPLSRNQMLSMLDITFKDQTHSILDPLLHKTYASNMMSRLSVFP